MDKISSEESISPQYECDCCPMKFRSKRVMSKHILSHAENQKKDEDLIIGAATSKEELSEEDKTTTPVLCGDCGGEFANAIALEQHERKHERKNRYKCTYCLETFRRHWKFTEHLKTHKGLHPYECRICFDSFKTEKYFQVHLKTHIKSEPKSFICNNCKKKFTHLALLNRHLLIHFNLKPYPCVLCDKTFPDVATRSRHVKNHAPLCLLCDKQPFENSVALRNHIEQMHRKKTPIKIAEIEKRENEHILPKKDENGPGDNIVPRKSPLSYSRIKNLVETPKKKIYCSGKKVFLDVGESNVKNTSSNVLMQNVSESGKTDEKCVMGQISKLTAINNSDVKPELQNLPLDVKPDMQSLPLDVKPELQNLPLDVSNRHQTVLSVIQNPRIENQNQLILQNFSVASMMPTTSSLPFSPDFFINWLKDFTDQCRLLKYPIEGPLLTKINEVQKIIFDLLASSSGIFSQKQNFQILLEIEEILEKVISDNMKYKLDMLAAS